MVFLEYDVDHPAGNRISRWWTAYTSGGTVYLPLIMASSGHRISSGSVSYASVYRGIVNDELARSSLGEVAAYSMRVGDTMRIWLRVVNRSDVTLSPTTNQPTVHAVVWEDAKVGVTSRYVRAAPSTAVAAVVEPGMVYQEALQTGPLTGVNWSKLGALAMLDYRPGGATGPYDMLQAALAQPADLSVEPSSLALGVAAGEDGPTEATVELRGPHTLSWTATADVPWLAVSPGAGAVPGQATVALVPGQLPSGAQEGLVTFAASSNDGLSFTQTVTVRAEKPLPRSRLRRRLFGVPASPGPAPRPAAGP